jgi:hypothetical protein
MAQLAKLDVKQIAYKKDKVYQSVDKNHYYRIVRIEVPHVVVKYCNSNGIFEDYAEARYTPREFHKLFPTYIGKVEMRKKVSWLPAIKLNSIEILT